MKERNFYELRGRGENPTGSGLTELNAATAVDRGFFSHNDWAAHVVRYGYAQKVIAREKPWAVLDYGCGTLQLPYFLWRNRTPEVGSYWGVDLRAQRSWLDEVGWSTPMSLVRADLVLDYPEDDVPTWPAAFDLVVCTEVLEHVPRDMAASLVSRLYAYTRPGGTCLLSSPNAGVSDSTAENHVGPEGSREWTYDAKFQMCVAAGFDVLHTFGTFGAARRLEPHVERSRELDAVKALLPHGWYTVVIAAAHPAEANNALFHLRRPK